MPRLALFVALALLALPVSAPAGGFATVQLSSLPDGVSPGEVWSMRLTILQHGRTPLDGLAPLIRVRSADGTAVREFAAHPTGEPGGYSADVVFPAAGTWHYEIWDGFTQTHTYAPVTVGGSPAGGGLPRVIPLAVGPACVALAFLAALLLVRRRRVLTGRAVAS